MSTEQEFKDIFTSEPNDPHPDNLNQGFHVTKAVPKIVDDMNTDKRHADPQHGGLSSGEKAAITRALKAEQSGAQPNVLHFTENDPAKAKAAEEFKQEKLQELKEKGDIK